MHTHKIKILIVEDYPLYRDGLSGTLMETNMVSEIAEAENGKVAINLMHQKHFDLVFLDIRMKVMNGYKTAKYITEHFPKVKIIALSMFDDVDAMNSMLKNGCHGYLTKNTDGDELIAAMKEVMSGGTYIDPELSNAYEREQDELKKIPTLESFNLTEREKNIIVLIASGNKNVSIAKKLILGFKTVITNRSGIYKKTDTKNTADITRFAIRYHLVEP